MKESLDRTKIREAMVYCQRADAKNRIKELKEAFAVDSFCLKKFWTTEAPFRSIMIAYHLLSLFRYIVLQTQRQQTLSTLRFKCFASGSWISTHSGKKVLKLSVSGAKRQWIDDLFSKVTSFESPFLVSNA